MGGYPFKVAILAFWTLWFSVVFLTNVFSALKAAGKVGPGWKFASKNYESVAKAVSLYEARPWVPRALFGGVLAWQLVTAYLFAAAIVAATSAGEMDFAAVNLAFASGMGFFGALMLADEVTIKYAYEQAHELLLLALGACLLIVNTLGP
jgi:hypothetical protein